MNFNKIINEGVVWSFQYVHAYSPVQDIADRLVFNLL